MGSVLHTDGEANNHYCSPSNNLGSDYTQGEEEIACVLLMRTKKLKEKSMARWMCVYVVRREIGRNLNRFA